MKAAWSFRSLRVEEEGATRPKARSIIPKQTEERDRTVELLLSLVGTLLGVITLVVTILAVTGSFSSGGGGSTVIVVNTTDGTVIVTTPADVATTLTPTAPPPRAPPSPPWTQLYVCQKVDSYIMQQDMNTPSALNALKTALINMLPGVINTWDIYVLVTSTNGYTNNHADACIKANDQAHHDAMLAEVQSTPFRMNFPAMYGSAALTMGTYGSTDVPPLIPSPPNAPPPPSPLAPGYHRVFESRLQNSSWLIGWMGTSGPQCASNCDARSDCTYFEFQSSNFAEAAVCALWGGACTPVEDGGYASNTGKWYYWKGCLSPSAPPAPPPAPPWLNCVAGNTGALTTYSGGDSTYLLDGSTANRNIATGLFVFTGVPSTHPMRMLGQVGSSCLPFAISYTGSSGSFFYGTVTYSIGSVCVDVQLYFESLGYGVMNGGSPNLTPRSGC